MGLVNKIGAGIAIIGALGFVGGLGKSAYDTFQKQNYKNQIKTELKYENPNKKKLMELTEKTYESLNNIVWASAIGLMSIIPFFAGLKLSRSKTQ